MPENSFEKWSTHTQTKFCPPMFSNPSPPISTVNTCIFSIKVIRQCFSMSSPSNILKMMTRDQNYFSGWWLLKFDDDDMMVMMLFMLLVTTAQGESGNLWHQHPQQWWWWWWWWSWWWSGCSPIKVVTTLGAGGGLWNANCSSEEEEGSFESFELHKLRRAAGKHCTAEKTGKRPLFQICGAQLDTWAENKWEGVSESTQSILGANPCWGLTTWWGLMPVLTRTPVVWKRGLLGLRGCGG